MKKTLLERFEEKIFIDTITGCWLWMSSIRTDGYGTFKVNYKSEPTHRFSYKLYKGDFNEKLWVLHKCDVRHCVNPSHLFLGNRQDNINDMINKKRNNNFFADGTHFGSGHKLSKLSENDIIKIRLEYKKNKLSMSDIGKNFGVSKSAISKIISNKTWKHI